MSADADAARPERRLAAEPVTTRTELRFARLGVAELFFMNGAIFGAWVSRLPAVMQARELSHAELGLHLLCVAAGAVLTIPLAGFIISRAGSRQLARVAALAFCSTLPLLAWVPSGAPFVAVLIMTGVWAGALDVSMNSQAVEVERRYRMPIMSSFHGFFSVGGLVGAAAGGVFAESGFTPLGHFAWMSALLALPTVWAITRLVREPRAEQPSRGATLRPKAAFDRATLELGALGLLAMVTEGAMADWSAVYLRRDLSASEAVAASGYAAFSITMAIGRFSGDFVTRRWGRAPLVRVSGLVALVSLASLLLVPWPRLAVLGFAGVGVGLSTLVPLVFSAAGSLRGRAPGVALATVTAFAYLGFLAGPPGIGLLAELWGLRVALGSLVLACGLVCLLAQSVAEPPA